METTERRPAPAEAVLHGLPGHPLHPPLTDATIGMFVLATALAVVGYAGALESAAGKACWLALVGGLIVAVPTAATGFADWGALTWGSPPPRAPARGHRLRRLGRAHVGLAALARGDDPPDRDGQRGHALRRCGVAAARG